jgi:hypothetical protein
MRRWWVVAHNSSDRGRVHRRQFIIGPEPVLVHPDWRIEELRRGVVLSWCPTLPLFRVQDGVGRPWSLIGRALATRAGGPDPATEIAYSRGAELDANADAWAGRWVLVGDGRVRMDAGGLLGCAWRTCGERELWISSSPALLAALPGRPRPADVPVALVNGAGMDWIPPPRSRFAGVQRLIPGQELALDTPSAPVRAGRSPDPSAISGGAAALEDALLAALRAAVEHAASLGRPWLALTGGYDSRLLLATCLSVGIEVQTYTFERTGLAPVDRVLAPRLAAVAGVPHVLFRPRRRSRAAARMLAEHTAGHTGGVDRDYVVRGQWAAIPPDAVVLRGGVFEVGRCFYYPCLQRGANGLHAAALARLVQEGFGMTSASAVQREGVVAWARWAADHPVAGVDWRDRFYLEQRVGGWLSPIEQALDATGRERIHPACSGRIISALLALDPAVRRESRHHVALISRLAPELLDLPFEWPGAPASRRRLRPAFRRSVPDP